MLARNDLSRHFQVLKLTEPVRQDTEEDGSEGAEEKGESYGGSDVGRRLVEVRSKTGGGE